MLIEQDVRHPHHYADSMEEFRGKTLLDIGSAEGFTASDTIEALQATFEPWKEKTMIVKKYISDHDDDVNAALDNFLKDKSRKDIFLKMDIEGAECMALQGSMELFAKADHLDFAICTYHKETDVVQIPAFLDRFNCSYSFTDGYMVVKHSVRKCLVRGSCQASS